MESIAGDWLASIVQSKLAGVESTRPLVSLALTLKLWAPNDKGPAYVALPELQTTNAAPSKLHSKAPTAPLSVSVPLKVNDALVDRVLYGPPAAVKSPAT